MNRSPHNPGLCRFAVGTAAASLLLIGVGGLVTSHEAGLAVPDWPTTCGQNMFLFPISKWTGGILYEHSHRLVASLVGLLTVFLALGLWWKESRAWLRRLGGLALVLVILQGVLGGLRVTRLSSQLGIFHAALAHLFLALVSAMALFTSRFWERGPESHGRVPANAGLMGSYAGLTLLVLFQLLVAATMRHQHAGLVIPDFPTAFGQWWPDLRPGAVAMYNLLRDPAHTPTPITAFQIALHLAHRGVALLILAGGVWVGWRTTRLLGWQHLLARLSAGWLALILLQVALGVATVWTGKSPNVATLHVVVGAMTLVAGSLITLVAWRVSDGVPAIVQAPGPAGPQHSLRPASLPGCV